MRRSAAARLAKDAVLDRLSLAVQLLELGGDPLRGLLVVGQQQLERRGRAAEAAGGVDPRGEPEADGALVDDGRIDAGGAHQRAQARPRGRARAACSPAIASAAVLVDERNDVGDRRERDQVEMLLERRGPRRAAPRPSL